MATTTTTTTKPLVVGLLRISFKVIIFYKYYGRYKFAIANYHRSIFGMI
jgi:hypothetical protein